MCEPFPSRWMSAFVHVGGLRRFWTCQELQQSSDASNVMSLASGSPVLGRLSTCIPSGELFSKQRAGVLCSCCMCFLDVCADAAGVVHWQIGRYLSCVGMLQGCLMCCRVLECCRAAASWLVCRLMCCRVMGAVVLQDKVACAAGLATNCSTGLACIAVHVFQLVACYACFCCCPNSDVDVSGNCSVVSTLIVVEQVLASRAPPQAGIGMLGM
jgi:hypothetical protein